MITYDDIKSGAVAVPMAKVLSGLPALVEAAAAQLANAKTAAEVLDAKERASLIYDAAKRAARMAAAKGAHDTLIAEAHRAQANALKIEAGAKERLADEYDAAQPKDAAVAGRPKKSVPEQDAFTAEAAGLTRKIVHEARRVRNAEAAQPGVVAATVEKALADGKEPTRAMVNEAVAAALGETKPEDTRTEAEREADEIQSPFDRAGDEGRVLFLARNNLQFQAKASEDNGSITGGAGAVTGEASRLASGRTDAGEAASVDLPTISEVAPEVDEIVAERNIFDELVALWKEADAGVRQDFKAYITGSEFVAKINSKSSDGERSTATTGSEHHSADHVSPPASQAAMGGGCASTGGEDVTHAGMLKTTDEAPQVEQTSLAAREGEKPLHSNSPDGAHEKHLAAPSQRGDGAARQSGDEDAVDPVVQIQAHREVSNPQPKTPGDADKAVAGDPQAPREPATVEIHPDPHSPRPTTGGLHTSSDAQPAQNDSGPHAVGQDRGRRVLISGQSEHQSAGNPQDRNEPVSGAPASVATFNNPQCQKPDTCRWAHSQASCSACASAAMKARAA